MTRPAVSAEGVSKRFGATVALDGVDFDVAFGEIHAVVGENGAGKSTLIRILGGVHRPDRGVIRLDGKECHFASPHDAIAAGIVTIPQDLRLVPALSIAENIALGDLPVRRFGPLAMVDRARMREEAREVLAQLDFTPTRGLASLPSASPSVSSWRSPRRCAGACRVFILDEPTAALEKREIARLFSVLARMQRQGTAIIYISHRLDEVVAIADRCTVLRDGRVAAVAAARRLCGERPRRRHDRAPGARGGRRPAPGRRTAARSATRRGRDRARARARGRRPGRPPRQRRRPDDPRPVRRLGANRRWSWRAATCAGSQAPPMPLPSASAWCRANARSASS